MAKSFEHSMAPVLGALPVSAQAKSGKVHIVLGNGKYAATFPRKPQDMIEAKLLGDAIHAQPLEPTTSGSGAQYHTLAVGNPAKVGGKDSSLSLVPLTAGVGGPVVAYVLVDLALAPELPEVEPDEDEDEDSDDSDDSDEDQD